MAVAKHDWPTAWPELRAAILAPNLDLSKAVLSFSAPWSPNGWDPRHKKLLSSWFPVCCILKQSFLVLMVGNGFVSLLFYKNMCFPCCCSRELITTQNMFALCPWGLSKWKFLAFSPSKNSFLMFDGWKCSLSFCGCPFQVPSHGRYVSGKGMKRFLILHLLNQSLVFSLVGFEKDLSLLHVLLRGRKSKWNITTAKYMSLFIVLFRGRRRKWKEWMWAWASKGKPFRDPTHWCWFLGFRFVMFV